MSAYELPVSTPDQSACRTSSAIAVESAGGQRRLRIAHLRNSFGARSICVTHHGTPGKIILPLAYSFGQTTTTCLPWC